jgi:uncharacterized protein
MNMLLDVSQALKAPGASYGFSYSESLEPMCAGGEEISFVKPLEVSGNYVFTGENFYLHGQITAEYQAICCRCLADVRSSMTVPFSEEFAKEPDENHPDRYLFRGEQLDLGQMTHDLVSLNTPMRHLCSENCKGLCPVCGADRNLRDCGCDVPNPDGNTNQVN